MPIPNPIPNPLPLPLQNKTFTAAIVIFTIALAYQTFAMASLTAKLADAKVGLGAGSSAVNLSSDGSAPEMVGGC